jgi:CRP-like cAMP-binding protein
VATIGAGDHAGELALLRNSPRSATVRALTVVETWSLAREPFLNAVLGSMQAEGGKSR